MTGRVENGKGRILGNDSGIALFLVLWVLMLLSVIVGEFCHAMRTETNVTRNYKEQAQAYYIALAGLHRAVAELVQDRASGGKTVVIEEGVDITKSVSNKKAVKEEEVPVEASNWRINAEIPPEAFGAGRFHVRIGNESGKVNLNEANESVLKMLLAAFDLDEKEKDILVDSILDWRDTNNLHRLNGAEDDFYRSLKNPYECKDGDFDTVEELLLVRGVTEELFYGGLDEMVTLVKDVRSSTRARRPKTKQSTQVSGSQKINVNAASPRMLRVLPGMTEEAVEAIVEYRREADLESLNDLVSVVGADTAAMVEPLITFQPSPYYTVEAVGMVNDTPIRQGIEVLVQIDGRQKTGYRILQWRDRLRQKVANER